MKKIMYTLLIIIFLVISIKYNGNTMIPDESIRFRIIANSNEDKDQILKKVIKQDLEDNYFPYIESLSKTETDTNIKNNEILLNDILNKYNTPYEIKYGKNYFPTKKYKGVTYPEGEYDSLVISLGEAKGKNWWCVMYPPLCLFESNSNNYENIEYEFYIKQILSNLTS